MASVNTIRKNTPQNDLYRTSPTATTLALRGGVFDGVKSVFDPCDGLGGITDVLEQSGIECHRSDLERYDGAHNDLVLQDFLSDGIEFLPKVDALVMNPPFKLTTEFLDRATELYSKVIMFNRISFLETTNRADRIISGRWRLTDVYIHAARVGCAQGHSEKYQNAVMYAWYVFDKSKRKKSNPQLHWLMV